MQFVQYALSTQLATIAVIAYAFFTHSHFYPSIVYLTVNKTAVLILFNEAIVGVVAFGVLLHKIFLGPSRGIEYEVVYEKLRYSFMEVCLALASFRLEITLTVVFVFTALLFSKVFHWLCEIRIEVSHDGFLSLLYILTFFIASRTVT